MMLEGVPDQIRWSRVGVENVVISFSRYFPEKKSMDELPEKVNGGVLKRVISPYV